MTRIISIVGNSGAGKSIITLNLALALANKGRDVIIMDTNIYSPDIANYSDISPSIFLNEYINGNRKIEDTLTYHPAGLRMIPAIAEDTHDISKHTKIHKAILSLMGKSEIILIDTFSSSPALSQTLNIADEVLFITNDDFPSIAKTKDFIRNLEKKGMTIIGVILNKAKKDTNVKHIEAILNKPVLAKLPFDNKVIESVNNRQPIFLKHPKNRLSKTISELADLMNV
jgi:flagellar biosynthesis protein FlhG